MIRSISTLLCLVLICQFVFGQDKFKEVPVANNSVTDGVPPLSDNTDYYIQDEDTTSITYNPIEQLNLYTGDLKVISLASNGTPNLIKGKLLNTKQYKSFNVQATAYLKSAKPTMGIYNNDLHFKTKREWKDELGMSHQKMRQNYKGVPIYGAEIILHSDKEGDINSLNGNYFATKHIELDLGDPMPFHEVKQIIKPRLKAYDEGLKAMKNLSIEINQWESDLVIYPFKESHRFAWHIEVHPNMGTYDSYFIDAVTGEIIDHYSNICGVSGHDHKSYDHELPNNLLHEEGGPETSNAIDLLGDEQSIETYLVGNTYLLIDASRSMFDESNSVFPNEAKGVITTFDARNKSPQNEGFDYFHITSSNNRWSEAVGVSAHANAASSYTYYKEIHKRESISGDGDNIYSFVNITDEDGDGLDNAFWNGAAIFYGNGDVGFNPLGGALDIAGHEMTHGVVQKMVGLDRTNESGALGEAFADIFGCMIERKNWLMGETVVKREVYRSGALRNLADPHNGTTQGNRGWQPKHYDERYLGEEDRGGVHINSGIINHAYYLFAEEVGIVKAEKVFYRVLDTYLTKSAQFIDTRLAVIEAADDLYTSSEMRAAEKAFDAVGVVGTKGNDAQEDVQVSDGVDLILYSTDDKSKLVLANGSYTPIADPLSETGIISRPSVTDAGDQIVFVGKDKKMHLISIDWSANTFKENILQDSPTWRNAVISKNGRWVAALKQRDDTDDNQIIVYDRQNGDNKIFTLTNPTFTEGVSTGDVLYADAMEFDFTNHNIVYDAKNKIGSSSAGDVDYWDVGFLNFWDKDKNKWASGNIGKLFSTLPEGVSIGNPTFSKNSPYILALDYQNINEDDDWQIIGVNIETSEVDLIKSNKNIGFPSYSRDDKLVLHNGSTTATINHLQTTPLNSSKIKGQGTQTDTEIRNAEWGVWFSNGERDFTIGLFETDVIADELNIFPNPTDKQITLTLDKSHGSIQKLEVFDLVGKKVLSFDYSNSKFTSEVKILVDQLGAGLYNIICTADDKVFAGTFVRQ